MKNLADVQSATVGSEKCCPTIESEAKWRWIRQEQNNARLGSSQVKRLSIGSMCVLQNV